MSIVESIFTSTFILSVFAKVLFIVPIIVVGGGHYGVIIVFTLLSTANFTILERGDYNGVVNMPCSSFSSILLS